MRDGSFLFAMVGFLCVSITVLLLVFDLRALEDRIEVLEAHIAADTPKSSTKTVGVRQ